MGPIRRRPLAAAALALAATACVTPPSTPPVALKNALAVTPTLWSAQPEGASEPSFYLLGSIHVGDARMQDMGREVERAFQRAEELVVEADVSRVDVSEARLMLQRYGGIAAPERLQDRLSPETWALLQQYLAENDLPPDAFDSVAPWLVATSIAVVQFRELGFREELGVDRIFTERAVADRMPIIELESAEEQFALFGNLSAELQDLMLRDTLERSADTPDEATQLMEAWAHGDDEVLEAVALGPLSRSPELEPFYESVLFERNERMAARLAQLALDGRVRLVVIGAGHMLGRRGIPALLADRGFEIRKTRSK